MTNERKPESDDVNPPAPQQSAGGSPPEMPPAKAPAAPPPEDGKFELADDKRLTEKVRQIMRAESFSGPTPHPKHVEQYEATLPGAAKILFDQFQANAEHQRRMEERQMALQERALELQGRDNQNDSDQTRRSQNYAASLVVVGLVAAIVFAYMKAMVPASLTIGTLLVSVLVSYLRGKEPPKPSTSTEDAVKDEEA